MVSLEHLWSLSILDPQGQLIERVVTNEKGIQKSMENKDLWILHPKSARLIPWEGKGALLDLKLIQGGYEAKVDAQGAQKPIALEAEKKAQAIEGLDTFDRLAKVMAICHPSFRKGKRENIEKNRGRSGGNSFSQRGPRTHL